MGNPSNIIGINSKQGLQAKYELRATKMRLLRYLLSSNQKRDWQADFSQSFFWYDTNFTVNI